MYLIHNTNISSLKSTLKYGYLKSYSLLKKENNTQKNGEGSGLYTKNNFVYFSCVDNLFDKKIHSSITMYFNSKLLFNKSFYVSTHYSPYPNELGEWWIKNHKGNRIKMYKRKYNRYYTKYNRVLKKLYDYSFSVSNGYLFQVFQQIAVRNKVNLNELVAIEFKKNVTDDIINYITKYYPNIIIKKK
jgi:hypothetical protein